MTLFTNQLQAIEDHAFETGQVVQVLALDGGGLKGLFTAAVIASIEKQLGHGIGEHFDIITGTSAGGLIALGLGVGKTGEQMAGFFRDEGPSIFSRQPAWRGWKADARGYLASKYHNQHLRRTLQSLYGTVEAGQETLLAHSAKRLVIPTLYAANSRPRLLKTPHSRRLRSDWRMPMWAVGMATSAAPTFLPAFEYGEHTFIDGGVWANNPSLVGVAEAIQLGAELCNVRVLNISTTSSPRDCLEVRMLGGRIRAGLRDAGALPWARRMVELVMESNSYATPRMYLHQMLAPGNLAVVDHELGAADAQLDHIDYQHLRSIGFAAGEGVPYQLGGFFAHRAKEYQPSKEAMAQ